MRIVAFSRATIRLVVAALLTGSVIGTAEAAGPLKPGPQAGPNLRFFTLADRLSELRRSGRVPEAAMPLPPVELTPVAMTQPEPEASPTASEPGPAIVPLPATEMLLGQSAVPVPDGELAGKWAEMTERWQEDERIIQRCSEAGCEHRGARRWLAILAEAQTLEGTARLSFVNRAFNRSISYATDFQIHGEADRWSNPLEVVEKAGDCEDYAIAKYLMLRKLGVEAAMMRLVVLFQPVSGQYHAILAVKQESDWLYLDNQQTELATTDRYRGVRPIATVNETGQALFLALPSYRIATR